MPKLTSINYQNPESANAPVQYLGVRVTPKNNLLVGVFNLKATLNDTKDTPEALAAVSIIQRKRDNVILALINSDMKDNDEIHIFACDKPVKVLMGIDASIAITPKELHNFVSKAVTEFNASLGPDYECMYIKNDDTITYMGMFSAGAKSTKQSATDKDMEKDADECKPTK